jgi:hypothetical protein
MNSDLEHEPVWAQQISLVDTALAENVWSRAFYAWHEAHNEAFRSGRWEALVAVGDAALRIDAVAGQAAGFRSDARRVYLAALVRARAANSLAGVRRTAEGFAKLGDQPLADHARRVAGNL